MKTEIYIKKKSKALEMKNKQRDLAFFFLKYFLKDNCLFKAKFIAMLLEVYCTHWSKMYDNYKPKEERK